MISLAKCLVKMNSISQNIVGCLSAVCWSAEGHLSVSSQSTDADSLQQFSDFLD